MKRWMLPLVLCVAGLAFAILAVQSTTPVVAEKPVAVAKVEPFAPVVRSEVINLPETGGAWHLTLFLSNDWRSIEAESELVRWFQTEPRLAKLKAQVHDHVYTPSSPLYRMRYAKFAPNTPAIALQDSTGKVFYKVGQTSAIPCTAAQLADDISNVLGKCPWKPKPKPTPDETPKPGPDDGGIPDMPVVPDIDGDKDEPAKVGTVLSDAKLFGIAALLFLVSAAVGAFLAAKNNTE